MLLFVFVLTIVLLILMIAKLKVHAFLSLLIAAIFFGILSGLPLETVATTITAGFGGTMQSIGIDVCAAL